MPCLLANRRKKQPNVTQSKTGFTHDNTSSLLDLHRCCREPGTRGHHGHTEPVAQKSPHALEHLSSTSERAAQPLPYIAGDGPSIAKPQAQLTGVISQIFHPTVGFTKGQGWPLGHLEIEGVGIASTFAFPLLPACCGSPHKCPALCFLLLLVQP